ncbi:MAG: hypothetical protein R6U39_06100 [Candidatus Aegiribacteria sp.]
MLKVLLALAFLMAIPSQVTGSLHGTSARGGLSGFPFLPGSDVLETGGLRIQGRLEYVDPEHSAGSYLLLPLSATWGPAENFEIGGEIPLYLDEPSEDGHPIGDVTAGCRWLYETARGGSAIAFQGQLRLPTGDTGRDRGSELELGVSTGTTFRLFRLQAAASYVINGSGDPFSDDIIDYMRFFMGGSSYVSENVQLVCSMDGSTLGELGLSGSGVFYALDGFAFFGTLRAGLDGGENFLLSGGLSWTGSGF